MSSGRLGLGTTAGLVVGHTIAVGIFLTPAQLIGALASPAWTLGLWLACGALVFAGALTFGELAARHPQSGGLYVYLREAFGPRAAFLYGWQALLIMDPGITAAIAVGLSQYVAVLWPAASGHERAVALGAIWTLALANMAGLRLSTRVLNLLAGFKVLSLAGLVGVAFLAGAGSWSHFVPFAGRRAGALPIEQALGLGLVAVFFSFGGFWEASRVAGDVRDPEKTLPRALALGVATVTLAYAAVTAALIYLVPIGDTVGAPELARRAGTAMLGTAGPSALAAVVTISVAGSAMALLFMAPRLYLAMSRDGLFPPALAALHPRTGAPARATAVLAAIASVLVLSGSFDQIVAFFLCAALAFVALAASALFVARRRGGRSPFLAPGYPATPALFVVFLTAVIACVTLARPRQALAGFALVLLGIPVYPLLASRGAVRVETDGGAP
ncbi:MAG TPA: amino acid permease [Thermoanaerobaculia bacterium]